jgi:DNA-damage-inducible protein J
MNATVKANVPQHVKADAENIFRQLGLDMTKGINMFLAQVVMHRGLPFEAKILEPNAETLRAIKDSHAGRVQKFGSVAAMVDDADD